MKMLLVEDNEEMVKTLQEEFSHDYIVDSAQTAEDAENLAFTNVYDVIILDLHLPDKNGSDICRKLRDRHISTPVLVLTGETEELTKVALLDLGADDYVTKPFRFPELKARIRALLRRKPLSLPSNRLTVSDLTLDLNRKVAERGGKSIELRRKEFYLLEFLIRNSGNVVTREMIIDHVWDNENESLTNVVDVHIKYLRDRIDKPFKKKLIKTVSGLGYKIEA